MRSNASAVALGILLAACGSTRESAGAPRASGAIGYGDYQDSGLASWYGEELAGSRTASGERFDPGALTAAHRSLPLGSFVEVTSVETGRSIIVRVNDRGPGRRDRIIDLSRGAAQALGTDRHAVANVRLRAIIPAAAAMRAGIMPGYTRVASIDAPGPRRPMPALVPGRAYALRIATFSNEDRARALARTLDADVERVGGLWRVTQGPFTDAKSLQRARDAVAARGYGDVQILPEDHILP